MSPKIPHQFLQNDMENSQQIKIAHKTSIGKNIIVPNTVVKKEPNI